MVYSFVVPKMIVWCLLLMSSQLLLYLNIWSHSAVLCFAKCRRSLEAVDERKWDKKAGVSAIHSKTKAKAKAIVVKTIKLYNSEQFKSCLKLRIKTIQKTAHLEKFLIIKKAICELIKSAGVLIKFISLSHIA